MHSVLPKETIYGFLASEKGLIFAWINVKPAGREDGRYASLSKS